MPLFAFLESLNDIYQENMDVLDLVALDMIMPQMSGKETYVQLKMLDPEIKVLLVSGYSLNKQIEELIALGCSGFIQKPFDIVQLSQKLREVLDAGRDDIKNSEARKLEEK